MVAAVMTPEAQGVGMSFPVPAPHNGLNSRENYTRLQPTEASVLQNILPDEGSCNVRPGYAEHSDISGATSVPTLMVFKGASGQELIAAADGELYDVTTSTAASLTTANYTNDRWSHDNFNGFLFGVNGTDTPWRYNGTATSATGFTGPTIANLSTVKQVRNRLWFTLNNSADVYYGGIAAVTGALTTFQLSQIASGGKCIAINSWSRDAGDGSDDFTVFIMDTGQVITYQGDPATSFSLVGKYAAPKLVEKDATVKIGGELVLMTVSGPIPMTAVIAGNAFSPDALVNWGKIAPSWQADYQRYKANAGWSAYFFNGIVYFNFPTGTATTLQYVYNTRVPAWTTYTNLPIASMADLGGDLYFGSYSDEWVYRHGTGTDNGASIVTLSRQGSTYPTNGAKSVRLTRFRPNIDADGPCEIQFCLDMDFQQGTLGQTYSITGSSSGADWGADWGSEWGAAATARRKWYSIRGVGRAVAPVVRTSSSATNVRWWSNDLGGSQGGQL
jgi:hypothetical protein